MWTRNTFEVKTQEILLCELNVLHSSSTFIFRSFRLKSQRPLKKLMIDDQGCDMFQPGIGNIAYVKDLQTEKIVTTGFRCSVFAGFSHHLTGLGWVGIIYINTIFITYNLKSSDF